MPRLSHREELRKAEERQESCMPPVRSSEQGPGAGDKSSPLFPTSTTLTEW